MRNAMKVWLGGFQVDPDGYDFVDPTSDFHATDPRYADKEGTFPGVI